jgi:hypothetical protein
MNLKGGWETVDAKTSVCPESISKQKREETENNTNCSCGHLLVGGTRDSFGNPSVQRAYGRPVGQCKFLLECSVGRQPMSTSLYSHFFREVVLTKTVIYFSLFCDISMRNKVVPERSMLGWGCIPHSCFVFFAFLVCSTSYHGDTGQIYTYSNVNNSFGLLLYKL